MSEKNRVAVVTGANKGIGFAIVQSLAPNFNGIVYLTGLIYIHLCNIS
jgi:NAD(P)-dependent dehydrogenase (short-subunit alcohol dehydrogenase family)